MHDLSLHLLDIVQNSIKAQASLVQVFIASNRTTDQITLTVVDDGKGMSPDQLALASDPFYTTRTTRSVGLGLPLLKELCEMTGGRLLLESQPGQGTRLEARIGLSSIDRPPLGDLGATWSVILSAAGSDIDFDLQMCSDDRQRTVQTSELRQLLDGVPLGEPAVLSWIRDFVAEMQQEIFGGIHK